MALHGGLLIAYGWFPQTSYADFDLPFDQEAYSRHSVVILCVNDAAGSSVHADEVIPTRLHQLANMKPDAVAVLESMADQPVFYQRIATTPTQGIVLHQLRCR